MEITSKDRIRHLSALIGNTPLLEVHFRYKDQPRVLYAKAEHMNMTGSIKDRMAFYIIKNAYSKGLINPESKIVEATSGNTGIAFSAIGKALGHDVCIFMPNWMSEERKNLIYSLGASIHLISPEEGGFLGSIQKAEELAKEDDLVFLPQQFSNEDNCHAHFETTGPEIWWQLQFRGIYPDAFVAGVGTGGTIMGAGRFLKSRNPNIQLHPLEPANSPTLTTGYKVGKHRIQGISDEFIPSIVQLDELDKVVAVDDGDAILMAQQLSQKLGLGVGISSGANLIGALKIQNELGAEAKVVTIFPDDNKKYLSTDLLQEEPIKSDYYSPHVELDRVVAFKRVCHTCCDPVQCVEARKLDMLEPQMIPLPPCPRRAKQ